MGSVSMDCLFDEKLEYQFGVFFSDLGDKAVPDIDQITEIGEIMEDSDIPPESPKIRLKLGKPVKNKRITITHEGSVNSAPVVVWDQGVWKMVWTPLRLDIFMNALSYYDITGTFLDPSKVGSRVVCPLADVVNKLKLRVSRLAMIVSGLSSKHRINDPTLFVTKKFDSGEIKAGNVQDISVRWNDLGSLEVKQHKSDHTREIEVNRIETYSSEWRYEGKKVVGEFMWQTDVNSSPVSGSSILFDGKFFSEFFGFAFVWTKSRWDLLHGQLGDL